MSRLQKLLGVGKGYLERLPPVDVHKLLRVVLMNFPYIVIFYVGNKLAWLYQYCVGDSMIERLMVLILNFQMAFSRILPNMHKNELLVGLTGAVAVKLMVYMKGKNAKKFRQGVEYGSARWGTAKDIAPFIDPVFENNILLTMTERLTMNGRPKNPKFARNKNVIVIGGSGSGKTRFYVKPNLMQMGKYISYVVTDPKGTIIIECGKMLVRHGYKVKVLNTINFSKSMHYNPFHYIHSEKDILKLVNTIMVNTKGEGEKSSEDFWTKAERLLYCALIGYIWYEAPEEEQNFATLLEFINASETREDDETFKNAVDMLFEELEKEEPEHFAVRQYKKYKLAAGKTAKSILISCGARLAPFDIAEIREIMSYDEMELDMVGDQRTALFIIISDTDDTFNFVVAMMYSQLFNLLCDRADDVHHGRLPYHVRILCDEFANIGQIPKFDKLIATIRSREISASIILQSQSQLKTRELCWTMPVSFNVQKENGKYRTLKIPNVLNFVRAYHYYSGLPDFDNIQGINPRHSRITVNFDTGDFIAGEYDAQLNDDFMNLCLYDNLIKLDIKDFYGKLYSHYLPKGQLKDNVFTSMNNGRRLMFNNSSIEEGDHLRDELAPQTYRIRQNIGNLLEELYIIK